MATRYVVFDCDMSVNDAWALLALLKGTTLENSGPGQAGYEIAAITTVFGYSTVEHCTDNTVRILNALSRADIPVFKGCAQAMSEDRKWPDLGKEYKEKFRHMDGNRQIAVETWMNVEHSDGVEWKYVPPARHANPGFGELKFTNELDKSCVMDMHAVDAMFRVVCDHPKLVDFILTGPLTNLATCIAAYGEAFLDNIGLIYAMGSNTIGTGDEEGFIEFNFRSDPEAAFEVLETAKQPITLLPFETYAEGNPMGLTQRWRHHTLGASGNKAIKLLNAVERYTDLPRSSRAWLAPEIILAMEYVFPEEAKEAQSMTVKLMGEFWRGRTCLRPPDQEDNVYQLKKLFKEKYRHFLLWTADIFEEDSVNFYDKYF